MTMRNEAAKVTLTEVNASTKKSFDWIESDEHTTLVVVATAATTLTVHAGDGVQGASDLAITLEDAGTYLIRLDSGYFKKKGEISITPNVQIQAGIVYQV